MSSNFTINDIQTLSNAHNSNAILQIERFGLAQFWLKEFKIPRLTLESSEEVRIPGNTFNIEGNFLKSEELSATIWIDEYLHAHYIFYTWLEGMKNGEDYAAGKVDGVIAILDNNRKEIIANVFLKGLFLNALPELTYTTFKGDDLTMDLSFAVDGYRVDYVKLTKLGLI